MKIKCNNGCKKIFDLPEMEAFQYRKENNELTKVFYICPYCNLEYLIHYENDNTLKLYNEIQFLIIKKEKETETFKKNQISDKIKKLITLRKKILEGIERDLTKEVN